MDLRKAYDASIPVISLGTAVILLHFILGFVTIFFKEGLLLVVGFALLGIASLAMVPAFFLLYLYAGYRAVKQGMDEWGAAATAGISYVAVGLIHFVLNAVYTFLLYGSVFVPLPMQGEAMLLVGVMGAASLLIQALYSIGIMMGGLLINFIVGGLGGVLARRL